MTDAASEHLKASGVTVKPYEAVLDEVRALASAGKKLWVNPAQARRARIPTIPRTTSARRHISYIQRNVSSEMSGLQPLHS